MADPLSVVAAVIGLAAIATKSTRAFLDIVSSARQVPHEIATTANDVRILHANLSFLVSLLNDREIEAALRSNKPLADLVSNLMHPLRDYERAVQKLTLKLRNVLSRKERSTLKPIARNLKFWIAAKDIRELRMNVEAAKSTLIMSLGAITL